MRTRMTFGRAIRLLTRYEEVFTLNDNGAVSCQMSEVNLTHCWTEVF